MVSGHFQEASPIIYLVDSNYLFFEPRTYFDISFLFLIYFLERRARYHFTHAGDRRFAGPPRYEVHDAIIAMPGLLFLGAHCGTILASISRLGDRGGHAHGA